jgi:predicted metal-dependent hydrolase
LEFHQNRNTEVGRARNLDVRIMDLREALLRLQDEWSDVENLQPRIRQVVIDNQISESEIKDTRLIIKELTEFIEVASSFRYSLLAQNAGIGMEEMIMNERARLNKNTSVIWKKQKTPVGAGAL